MGTVKNSSCSSFYFQRMALVSVLLTCVILSTVNAIWQSEIIGFHRAPNGSSSMSFDRQLPPSLYQSYISDSFFINQWMQKITGSASYTATISDTVCSLIMMDISMHKLIIIW